MFLDRSSGSIKLQGFGFEAEGRAIAEHEFLVLPLAELSVVICEIVQ